MPTDGSRRCRCWQVSDDAKLARFQSYRERFTVFDRSQQGGLWGSAALREQQKQEMLDERMRRLEGS
jgi:hypothetical protein